MKTIFPLAAVLLLFASQTFLSADDWPQWRGPNRDGVWRETGLIDKFDGPEIKPRWRVPLAGGYCGPTVAYGRVYVADRVTEPREMERVHCFDWKTGRLAWGAAGPGRRASSSPLQHSGGSGGRKRRAPVGGAANGMPRKA